MNARGRVLTVVAVVLTVGFVANALAGPPPHLTKIPVQTAIYKLTSVSGSVTWPPTSAGRPADTNAATACDNVTVSVSRKTESNAWQTVREGKATPANSSNYAAGCRFKLTNIPKNQPLYITARFHGAWQPPLGKQEVFSDSIPFTLTGDSMTFTLHLKVVEVPW